MTEELTQQTAETAREIALGCEAAYTNLGWSANDTDDLADAITEFGERRYQEGVEHGLTRDWHTAKEQTT